MRWAGLIVGCLAVAAASALVVAPAPAYDPWSWLLWGREVAHGMLSTTEGPAFKPLPVAVTALLAPLGDEAAPVAWVVLARAAAVAAIALAFVVGRRLPAGGPESGAARGDARPARLAAAPHARLAAGALAAAGVAFCGAYPTYAASGDVTGLFVALVLGGLLAWWAGRPGVVLACAVGCALLRVEAWPFVVVLGLVLWRRAPSLRVPLTAAAVLVPLAWFVPEWLGSGDLLRSGERARVPNPGQPAEASVPALASLWDAVQLPLWPLLAAGTGLALGVVAAARTPAAEPDPSGPHVASARASAPDLVLGRRPGARLAAALAGAGVAWVVLVAVMAQVGFSGEPRYALPGAALVAVAGAVAIAGLPRAFVIGGAVLVTVAALPRVADLGDLRADQRHQWSLARDLPKAIALYGGRDDVLRCGTPYVGPYRGPLLAYHLDVAKEQVEPDAPPSPPGVVFRSPLHRDSPRAPATSGFEPLWGMGDWDVFARCG